MCVQSLAVTYYLAALKTYIYLYRQDYNYPHSVHWLSDASGNQLRGKRRHVMLILRSKLRVEQKKMEKALFQIVS